ncbi:MAG: hypothetical protein V7774_09060 [Pseudorhizobium pelagicum]|uniref:hypothetical protein n=1 Tax=Pseudorhizobium pelagicum TaxID=1509405 RepID=UPI0034600226
MNGDGLFTDRAERRCDPQLIEIITERITIWNRPLAYLLSGAVAVALGFAAAAGV